MPTRTAQPRKCPQDGSLLAHQSRRALLHTVDVDACPACGGLFLDKGEIKSLTGDANLNKLLTKYLGFDSDSAYHCSNCGWVMDGENAGGIRVDVCLKCLSVWLDAGELEKLRKMPDKEFKRFSPEKWEEILRAKRIAWEERDDAFRAAFRDLYLSRKL